MSAKRDSVIIRAIKKKKKKENVGLLLNHDLVKVDADKPEINATFAVVFTDKISWTFEPRDRIQEREDLPDVEEDQDINPYDWIGNIQDTKRAAAVIERPLSIVVEGLQRL